jgi:hypothetical protein
MRRATHRPAARAAFGLSRGPVSSRPISAKRRLNTIVCRSIVFFVDRKRPFQGASMKISVLAEPDEVPDAIKALVTQEVSTALQDVKTIGSRFIVNDTLWYAVT